jgi:hypothetical protein
MCAFRQNFWGMPPLEAKAVELALIVAGYHQLTFGWWSAEANVSLCTFMLLNSFIGLS